MADEKETKTPTVEEGATTETQGQPSAEKNTQTKEEAAQPKRPSAAVDDPVLRSILGDLINDPDMNPSGVNKVVDDEQPPRKVETEEKPKEEEKKEEEARQPRVVKNKPVRDVVEETVRGVLEGQRKAEAAATAPKKETKSDDPFAGWTKAEMMQYEMAKLAEKEMPDRYKGMTSKISDYRKKHSEFVSKLAEDFDPQDHEYQEFVRKHQPKYQADDFQVINQTWLADKAADRAAKRLRETYDEKIARLERDNRSLRYEPKVGNAMKAWSNGVSTELEKSQDVGPLMKQRKELGEKFEEEFPTHGPAVRQILDEGRSSAETYMRIQSGLEEYDPKNETHGKISGIIEQHAQAFAKSGGEARRQKVDLGNGQAQEADFVTRSQFYALAADPDNELYKVSADPMEMSNVMKTKDGRWVWTFGNAHVLGLFGQATKNSVERYVKETNEKLRKSQAAWEKLNQEGQVRANQSPAQATAQAANVQRPEPERFHSPVVTGSVAPSPSGQAMKAATGSILTDEEKKVLGIPLA